MLKTTLIAASITASACASISRSASRSHVVAEQFLFAQKWMLATREKWPSDMQMPTVACAAFALELYFKCLLSMEQKEANQVHQLRVLFNQLSQKAQNEIRGNVDLKMMTQAITHIHNAWRGSKQSGEAPQVDFDWLLDASDDAFNIARYIFEKGLPGGKGWVADPILQATRRTILKRKPSWRHARQASPPVSFDGD